jgi:signal transduction histidine kinase
MARWVAQWWKQLRIQHKVWAALFLLCIPLAAGLATHLYAVQQLLDTQQVRSKLVGAESKVNLLQRLAVDIEDGFRGYLVTRQPIFLGPLVEAEAKLDHALEQSKIAVEEVLGSSEQLGGIETQLRALLQSKHEMIRKIESGDSETVFSYVRSGEGLLLSDRIRNDLRVVEDTLEQRRLGLNEKAQALSEQTFVGLWLTLIAILALGWIVSRVLAYSLTQPIMKLKLAAAEFGANRELQSVAELLQPASTLNDELGELTTAYLKMTSTIQRYIDEIEVLSTIGHEINTIGQDGLEGVLRKITDRAVELIQADACLVLLHDRQMGCWVIEAANGSRHDRLKKSVMLWEELPVCVKAYETGEVAVGEQLSSDHDPQFIRRNLIGNSMLAIPLLAQGNPMGVLALLCEEARPIEEWNQRLATGMAQEAAVAISNARLVEAAEEKSKVLLNRLRHLEHQAEALAHDLKGPSERVRQLAMILREDFGDRLDVKAQKWIELLEFSSKEMVERVEGILNLARIGGKKLSLIAVDPSLVIYDVLKSYGDEIHRRGAVVEVASSFPIVACHPEYLRQVFDNLISNSLKYARPGTAPMITISSSIEGVKACFTVTDEGIGIPSDLRTKVFQPFVRVMESSEPGSGIGLSIVQRIIELYEGEIRIEGNEGEGCTIKFTLPCLDNGLR